MVTSSSKVTHVPESSSKVTHVPESSPHFSYLFLSFQTIVDDEVTKCFSTEGEKDYISILLPGLVGNPLTQVISCLLCT